MSRVRLADEAHLDLYDIWEHIAQDSPQNTRELSRLRCVSPRSPCHPEPKAKGPHPISPSPGARSFGSGPMDLRSGRQVSEKLRHTYLPHLLPAPRRRYRGRPRAAREPGHRRRALTSVCPNESLPEAQRAVAFAPSTSVRKPSSQSLPRMSAGPAHATWPPSSSGTSETSGAPLSSKLARAHLGVWRTGPGRRRRSGASAGAPGASSRRRRWRGGPGAAGARGRRRRPPGSPGARASCCTGGITALISREVCWPSTRAARVSA